MSKLFEGIAKAQKSIAKSMGTDRMYNATEHDAHVCGIKIPTLAYQIYTLVDHLPFGIHGESAPPHVGKTLMSIQKGIWAIQDGCWANITDTEHKNSVDMVLSMVRRGLPKELWPLFKHTPAYSLEESQQINTQLWKTAKEDKLLPIGDRYGIYNITDSMLGAAGQDSIDTILKEGFAKGRGYKEETLSIKNYCEAFDVQGAYYMWNTVQHAKKSLDPNARGIGAWNVIGGDAPRFVAMTHTLMQRADQWDSVENNAKVSGHNIRLTLLKNGVGGDDRRTIMAGLRWTHVEDPETGQTAQETWFDWDWSLGWLLAQQTLENPKVPAGFKTRLKDILHFTVKNKNNVECKRYSDKAITYSQFGRCIEEDDEIREAIKNLFGVKKVLNYKDPALVSDATEEPKKRGRRKVESVKQEPKEEEDKQDAPGDTETLVKEDFFEDD